MVPFSAFATSRWEQAHRVWNAIMVILRLRLLGNRTGGQYRYGDGYYGIVSEAVPNGFGLEWTAMSYQERLSGRRLRRCTPFPCWWYSCVWLRV